ncbi:Vegetative incompatibility protein HET-E-1 [Ceratobasidium sp. AG-Ba]|nr:Vegetative incompatibility protein HET-E-1 [Ceratobasidium sp. AG-Ba]
MRVFWRRYTSSDDAQYFARGIEQEVIFIIRKQRRTKIETLIGSTRDVDEIAECQDRVRRLLERPELNVSLSMWKTVDEIAMEALLNSLPVAPEAKHRSAESIGLGRVECATNTRARVLNDLNDWADAENSEEIYWLNAEQFDYMIASPLHTIQPILPGNLVVVIDALDGCESADGMAMILDVIFSRAQELPAKFFVASRPDAMILDRMRKSAGGPVPAELRLHELDHPMVQGDIKLYLSNKLQSHIEISEDDLETLAARTGVLFIYVATVVRYIIGNDTPRSPRRLQGVLKSQRGNASSNSSNKEIDALYTTILESAINDPKLDDIERDETRLVLHTVICAQEPPSLDILAGLLKLHRDTSSIHSTSPSRNIYSTNDAPLYFTAMQKHIRLMAQLCFEQTSACSPFNICNLDSSYMLDEEVEDMGRRIKEYIPRELLYACRYWAAHLKLANDPDELAATMLGFLSERVLVWMEIMNLNNCIYETARSIYEAREWPYLAKQPDIVHQLLSDAREFVSSFSSSRINLSTPHIYVSHLSFWSKEAPMAECYQLQGTSLISNTSTAMSIRKTAPVAIFNTVGEVNCLRYSYSGLTIASNSRDDSIVHIWDARNGRPTGKPLEGHTDAVTSLAYSPDDAYIVSGSMDCTIRIWDTHTGKEIGRPLAGHTKYILTAAYSPDGSEDNTIRIWDANTGNTVSDLLWGHTLPITTVAYSLDGAYIFSSSLDRTVKVWDADTSRALGQPLEDHDQWVSSIAPSRDGASGDGTVCIWDASTDQVIGKPLKGHTGSVCSVAYGSLDKTIRIWNIRTGELIGKPLEGHESAVRSVAYSSDGAFIVSGSDDFTIQIWDALSGKTLGQSFEGHTDKVLSVAFSPDGLHVVLGSNDETVRVWDSHRGKAVGQILRGHTGPVLAVAYSPCAAYIVSDSEDMTVHIWDANTGNPIGALMTTPFVSGAHQRARKTIEPPHTPQVV